MRETSGDEELVTFHFRKIPLWELDAREYFDEHEICMYALLPAMCGASREMHMRAIDQMIEYYQGDDDELRNQLLCFGIMMRRAEMLPAVEIQEVAEKMKYYDPLIAEDKYLQDLVEELAEKRVEKRAQEIAEKRAEEIAEARVVAKFQETLIHLIKAHFPLLARDVEHMVLPDKPDALELLIVQILSAPDERVARVILCLPPAE